MRPANEQQCYNATACFTSYISSVKHKTGLRVCVCMGGGEVVVFQYIDVLLVRITIKKITQSYHNKGNIHASSDCFTLRKESPLIEEII